MKYIFKDNSFQLLISDNYIPNKPEKLIKTCDIDSPCPESDGPCKRDYDCRHSLTCGFKNCDLILTETSANKCCMNKSGIIFLYYTILQ